MSGDVTQQIALVTASLAMPIDIDAIVIQRAFCLLTTKKLCIVHMSLYEVSSNKKPSVVAPFASTSDPSGFIIQSLASPFAPELSSDWLSSRNENPPFLAASPPFAAKAAVGCC